MSLSRTSKKTGRPCKEPAAVRVRTIGVRVNRAELEQLQAKAQALGVPLSQCIRELALNRTVRRPVVPEINRTAYAELARLAANLNQLMRHTKQCSSPVVSQSILTELQHALNALRLELLGVDHDS